MVFAQMLHDAAAAHLHEGVAARVAIGRVAAVGEVDEALVRQLMAQGLQHAEAADAAVENADGRGG